MSRWLAVIRFTSLAALIIRRSLTADCSERQMEMEGNEVARFQRKQNEDETFDSICTCCSRTIATSQGDTSLQWFESNHRCWQGELMQLRRATSPQRVWLGP